MSISALPGSVISIAAKSYPIRHSWNVKEFERMGETGFLHPESRLERLVGVPTMKRGNENPRATRRT